MLGVIVCEFCQGQEIVPIVLLVIAEYTEILFKDLVNPFGLAI